MKSTVTKLWQHKGLCKVIAITQNVFQFIFVHAEDREGVLKGRPWLFDNFVLVLQPWSEGIQLTDSCFNVSPFWVQVWNTPHHWLSIASGMKIGSMLGKVLDVLVVDSGGREERHLNIQVELDLTKPLMRGTMLKYKLSEVWVEFRYEQLPNFCYYCGKIGHNEKVCQQRKHDVLNNCVNPDQFGTWMRAGFRRSDWKGPGGQGIGTGGAGAGSGRVTQSIKAGVELQGGCADEGDTQKIRSQGVGTVNALEVTSDKVLEPKHP